MDGVCFPGKVWLIAYQRDRVGSKILLKTIFVKCPLKVDWYDNDILYKYRISTFRNIVKHNRALHKNDENMHLYFCKKKKKLLQQ